MQLKLTHDELVLLAVDCTAGRPPPSTSISPNPAERRRDKMAGARTRSIGPQFRRGLPPGGVLLRARRRWRKGGRGEEREASAGRERGASAEGGAKQLRRRENVVASRKERGLQMEGLRSLRPLALYTSCMCSDTHAQVSVGHPAANQPWLEQIHCYTLTVL